MATAHARRLATGDETSVTPAVGPTSGKSQFSLSSGAATAVVFVSIVLCFILLCTYCRCARQRAIGGRAAASCASYVSASSSAPPARRFPVVPYASAGGAKKGQPEEDCSVCLEAFRDDDGVKVVPACGHVFHAPCIDRWLDVRNSCPVCRCAVVCYYSDRSRDATVAVGGDGDDQEVVLERVVAMIEAIREEEAAARRAPASAGGDGG